MFQDAKLIHFTDHKGLNITAKCWMYYTTT